jgi:Sulfotransferase family
MRREERLGVRGSRPTRSTRWNGGGAAVPLPNIASAFVRKVPPPLGSYGLVRRPDKPRYPYQFAPEAARIASVHATKCATQEMWLRVDSAAAREVTREIRVMPNWIFRCRWEGWGWLAKLCEGYARASDRAAGARFHKSQTCAARADAFFWSALFCGFRPWRHLIGKHPMSSPLEGANLQTDLMEATRTVVGANGWKSWGDRVSRRLWRLDGDALIADARRRTRLEDFGDPPLEPMLSLLTDSLEREANLHPLGRFLMRGYLLRLLETRLQLADDWHQRGDALDACTIRRPVFITGMPRSGSSFLHELLVEDPDNRAPLVWEVMYPVPAPDPKNTRPDPRIWKAAASLWCFRQIVRQADAVYPVRARTPHECIAIHSYTLWSEEFLTLCQIPAYEAFLRSTSLQPAYAWERRFLQHLQSHSPAKRWVLKAPDHVYGLEELFSVFPDAVVIQTHRNPLEVLRSSSHLLEVMHGLFARTGGHEQIARREARELAAAMDRSIQFRDRHPELAGRFIDMKYSELASDPLAAVRRIYEQLGLPLTETAAERMRRLASARSRYRGRHATPTLADLGFDPPTEAQRFDHYCVRFGIPCRQPG